jgi:hypothetical protein
MRVRPVVPRAQAQRDIEEAIAHYLAEDSEQAAMGFVDALEQAFAHIGRHPATGSPRYAHELNLAALRCWLEQTAIHYWGDIDTHGFAILDQLRHHFSHVESFLMDRATVDAHVAFWGREDKPQRADLHRLTQEKLRLYDDLRDNRIREGLRLEQEHLSFGWVRERIEQLLQQD